MTVEERAKDLREKKQKYEDLKEKADEAKLDFKTAQAELLEYMDANDIEGVKTDGVNFVPTKTYYGQITDRKAFIAWAEENDDELLEPKERKSVLNERARQLLDDGEEFPPGMGFRVEEYISQRSA
jgi:hypothetical protein